MSNWLRSGNLIIRRQFHWVKSKNEKDQFQWIKSMMIVIILIGGREIIYLIL